MTDKTVTVAAVAALDASELACRIAEAYHGITRPENKTPEEALDGIPADLRENLLRAAFAAAQYVQERMNSAELLDGLAAPAGETLQ